MERIIVFDIIMCIVAVVMGAFLFPFYATIVIACFGIIAIVKDTKLMYQRDDLNRVIYALKTEQIIEKNFKIHDK